jgi:tricorn protease-like protein
MHIFRGTRRNVIRYGAVALFAIMELTGQALAALPRYPHLHNGMIVFVADGNLWEVPRTGGTAHKLTSDPGQDVMPRYSPDGKGLPSRQVIRAT